MSFELVTVNFVISDEIRSALAEQLSHGKYVAHWSQSEDDFFTLLSSNQPEVDCIIVEHTPQMPAILQELKQTAIFLPVLVVVAQPADGADAAVSRTAYTEHYHDAVGLLVPPQLEQLERYIHKTIRRFLQLPVARSTSAKTPTATEQPLRLLEYHQQRLTEKLKERLGYLGVYYKRNPDQFLRNMSQAERKEFLQQMQTDYRAIVLSYFSEDSKLNKKIDDFVDLAFFADASVSQIVEIHMDLMDEFSKQLKLEGRSEEILLDYRLTLIDVIAHLCEMYRRSIPREA